MKYLFFISFASFIFLFSYLISLFVEKRKNSFKDFFIEKFKKRARKARTDPRLLKILDKVGGKKKGLILLSICFFILIIFRNLIFVMIAAIFYFYINWNIKNNRAKKRRALIDKQVVEALSIIKNAVLAGKTIQDAIILAANDIKEPLKTEFAKIAKDISLGISLDKALEKASQNAPSKEYKLMTDTIRLSVQSGASISGIFERITDLTSQRIALFEKIEALTAQGKMSGNVVSAVPFVVMLMMSLLQPEMMNVLFNTLAGNILLLIVVIMIIAGSFAIRKLTEVDC
jgi:tight adherence protein B